MSAHLIAVQWALSCRVSADPTVSAVKIKGRVANASVKVEIVHPSSCESITKASGLEIDDLVRSMQAPLGGGKKSSASKSGSKFWFSECRRFFVKEINDEEMDYCVTDLPRLAEHVQANPATLLSRILGAFIVHVDGAKLDFVIIANVVEARDELIVMYDLKGTTENRLVKPAQFTATKVGKDENFRPHTIHLRSPQDASVLRETIEADCRFLASQRILDYSMLIAICRPAQGTIEENVKLSRTTSFLGTYEDAPVYYKFAIIDTLQRWTPKKKAAHVLKRFSMRLVYEIDTEPPNFYNRRFVKKMTQKITSDP